MTAERAQIECDLDQFAALAPTLGRNAQRETRLDVLAAIDGGQRNPYVAELKRAVRHVQRIRRKRRNARKARRGWR